MVVFIRNILYFSSIFGFQIVFWEFLKRFDYSIAILILFFAFDLFIIIFTINYFKIFLISNDAPLLPNLLLRDEIIWEINSKGDQFLNICARDERLLNYTKEEWLKPNFLEDFIYPLDKEITFKNFQDMIQIKSECNFSFRFYTKNRNIVWFEAKLEQIKNQNGIEHFYGTLTDITEQKKKESLLQFHSDILNKMSEGVFLLRTSDAKIIYTNPSFDTLFGYKNGELIGKHVSILNSSDTKPSREVADEINANLYKDGFWRGEVHNQKKNGESFWSEVNVSEYIHPEYGLVWISVHNDITQRKKMEEDLVKAKQDADKANQAKTDFLVRMSHEIRTPMNGILGITSLLVESDLSPEKKGYAELAVRGVEVLESLVLNIMDFSKIESGTIHIEKTECNLSEMIHSIFSLFELQAKEKGLDFNLEMDIKFPQIVICDMHKIRQILINLISNAIKFTNKGYVKIKLRVIEDLGDKKNLEILVQDSGIGIKEEQKIHVFESFFQADPSMTRKYGGSGLGLSISKKLVNILGGNLSFESKEGIGSTFCLSMIVEIPKERVKNSTIEKVSLHKENPKILIADDDDLNAMVAIQILKSKNIHNVTHVYSGLDALKEIETSDYDLIFMDLRMPSMDGIETTVLIRRISDIPIVAITGEVIEGEREKCLAAGMNDFYTKPMSASDFMKIIHEWT
ncbi:MAG TPA: ATP-binding protein [Leptospiraceae bacterium]|nr:ATP-binding protein [Leptospiraceae bacterium]